MAERSEDESSQRAVIELVCVFVLGAIQDLRDAGRLSGCIGGDLLPSGIARYDQLRASGFRPNEREIDMMMSALSRSSGETIPPAVIDLVKRFARDEIS